MFICYGNDSNTQNLIPSNYMIWERADFNNKCIKAINLLGGFGALSNTLD